MKWCLLLNIFNIITYNVWVSYTFTWNYTWLLILYSLTRYFRINIHYYTGATIYICDYSNQFGSCDGDILAEKLINELEWVCNFGSGVNIWYRFMIINNSNECATSNNTKSYWVNTEHLILNNTEHGNR